MQKNHSDSISIVPFRFKYLPKLLEMLQDREFIGLNTITMKTLPKIGYMALLHGQPIAAGFLRRVEGGYAQMDTLVSNPYFGSIVRHEGISKVVDALITEAKELDLIGIIGFTSDLGVLMRSEVSGFHKVEQQQVIALRLRS